MNISSPVFDYNNRLPEDYTCDGQGYNPPLLFLDVPQDAKSLVLILDDPDAPNGTFTHWLVFNIDPAIKEVLENSEPKGTPGKNSTGNVGYVPPCPPASKRGELTGEHRYIFHLYALDSLLNLPEGATKEELEKAMEGHILDSSELIGLYSRETE